MRIRDLIAIAAGALGLMALVTWWLQESDEELPAPSPVSLGPADPAQHFGADAAADQDLADEVVAETDGDLVAAERRFGQRRGSDVG